jgi:hypothetical protein
MSGTDDNDVEACFASPRARGRHAQKLY